MKQILITGGAGYIGSHTVLELKQHGYQCIVIDDLSEGHKEAVFTEYFEPVDLRDYNAVDAVFKKYRIDTVVHFAGYTYVGESMTNPRKYYDNNVYSTMQLLNAMLDNNVKNIVFSSTCAVYGLPSYIPLNEEHPLNPMSVYGKTKHMIEQIIQDYSNAYGLNYVALRYFNAAGAHPEGVAGESHNIETHLIPLTLQALSGKREGLTVYGTDYPTKDGTCLRDYIHVCDLACAHRLAVEKIGQINNRCINLGTGSGYSVQEIINTCEQVTGFKADVAYGSRRPGDPPVLVADNALAEELLGWKVKYKNIHDIIETAWRWENNRKY